MKIDKSEGTSRLLIYGKSCDYLKDEWNDPFYFNVFTFVTVLGVPQILNLRI